MILLAAETLDEFFVALHQKGPVLRVDHLARERPGGLSDVFHHRVVDRDLARAAPLGEVGRDHRRLFDAARRRFLPLAAEKDKYLRLAAEYDNYRKRSQKEKENIYGDAKADTVLQLLPVYDNLERALKADCSDDAFYKGVEMIMDQLMGIFAKLGVEVIQTEGQTFDPALHNAVIHVEDESLGENVVAEEFQKGFTLNGKVIRFAMVKVAN